MSSLTPFLILHLPYSQVRAWVAECLSAAGLNLVRTFDLQMARRDSIHCLCSHGKTQDCDCQMAVFLVWQGSNPGITLIIHGWSNCAFLSLAYPGRENENPYLASFIQDLLGHRLTSYLEVS